MEDSPSKRRCQVPSYLPFLLILLIAFAALPVPGNVASSFVEQADTPSLGLGLARASEAMTLRAAFGDVPYSSSYLAHRPVGVQQSNTTTIQAEVLNIVSTFEGSLIYSYVTLLVTHVIEGPGTLRGTNIVLKELGGEVNGTLLWLSDVPYFFVGENVEISVQQQGNVYVSTSPKKTLAELLGPATAAGYLLFWCSDDLGCRSSTTSPGPGWYGPLRRPSATFDYWINPQGIPSDLSTSSFIAYATASFATWQDDPDSAIAFTYRGTETDLSAGANDNVNVVGWGNLGGTTIACTIIWGQYTSGSYDSYRITETDMIFDNSKLWSAQPSGVSGRFDVQNIGTHEAGHTFGLMDMYESADSEHTMYGYSSTGETKKRTLEWGDRAGVAALYPQPAATVTATVTVTSTVPSTLYSYRTTTTTSTSYTSTTTTTSTIPTLTTVALLPLTVTSIVQSIQYLTSILAATVTSYTSTQTSTSTIVVPTTVTMEPSTSTSTVETTQVLTSTGTTRVTSYTTTTVSSYTGTEMSMSTIVVPTTVTVGPSTSTSTIETTQVLTSTGTTTVTSHTTTTLTSYTDTSTLTSTFVVPTTVTVGPSTSTQTILTTQVLTSTGTTAVTSYTTATVTSYTGTSTSMSTIVVYTTVTTSESGAGASSPFAYLGFLSLLAVTAGHSVTARQGRKIPRIWSLMQGRKDNGQPDARAVPRVSISGTSIL